MREGEGGITRLTKKRKKFLYDFILSEKHKRTQLWDIKF